MDLIAVYSTAVLDIGGYIIKRTGSTLMFDRSSVFYGRERKQICDFGGGRD